MLYRASSYTFGGKYLHTCCTFYTYKFYCLCVAAIFLSLDPCSNLSAFSLDITLFGMLQTHPYHALFNLVHTCTHMYVNEREVNNSLESSFARSYTMSQVVAGSRQLRRVLSSLSYTKPSQESYGRLPERC